MRNGPSSFGEALNELANGPQAPPDDRDMPSKTRVHFSRNARGMRDQEVGRQSDRIEAWRPVEVALNNT
jgi:hypothetical protein